MHFVDAKFWLAIAFFTFLLIIYKLAWLFLSKMIAGKADQIAKDLNDAKEAKARAESLLEKAQQSLDKSLENSKQIIAEAEDEAKKLIADSKKAVEDEINRKVGALNERLKAEEEKAVRDIKSKIVAAALQSVKDDLSDIDKDKVANVVKKSIDDISKIIH